MIPDDVLHEIKTAPDDLPMSVKIPPYCRGVDDERHRNRIAAFSAIRRAAQVARNHDQKSADWERNGVQDLADKQWFAAACIRYAIRAAIGSPKA